ncbi:hypothetical protein NS234_04900 [Microbacterium oxydans]|nr:hypothetical protein NS234_04900 [Microbacterium oxydans]
MTVVLTPRFDMTPVPRVEMVVESADIPAGTNRVTLWRVADGREFKVRGGVDRTFTGGSPLEVRRNVDVDPAGTGTSAHSASQSGAGSPTFTATSTLGMNVGGMGIDTFVRVEATTASTYLDVRGTATNNVLKTPLGPDIAASAWVRPSSIADPIGRVYIQQYNSSNTLLGTSDIVTGSISSGWNRVGFSVPRLAGAVRAVAIFRIAGTVPVGARLDVTGFLTESANSVGRWFSGSSTPYLGYAPSWLSAVNASASIESAGTGSLSLIDYEPPLRGSFTYEAECWAGSESKGRVSIGTVTSPWVDSPEVVLVQQPLDPNLSLEVLNLSGSWPSLSQEAPGELVFAEGAARGTFVGFGPRRGLSGVQIDFGVSSREQAASLRATLGTERQPQLPIWLIRSTGEFFPKVVFCVVKTLVEVDIDTAMGDGWSRFQATVTECEPPAPALVIATLSYSDLDAGYASYTARDAAYASYDAQDRDYSLAGLAG